MNLFWRLSSRFYRGGGKIIGRCFELASFFIGANAISGKAKIGKGTTFHHRGVGCVVHDNAVIGENCHIFQNVTIGSKWASGKNDETCPQIGDNVMIGAGAVIIGEITIGNNAVIGANTVVTRNVPEGVTCVGVPGKIKGVYK